MKYTNLGEQERHGDIVSKTPDKETMKMAAKNIKKWRKNFKDWREKRRTNRVVSESPDASGNYMHKESTDRIA